MFSSHVVLFVKSLTGQFSLVPMPVPYLFVHRGIHPKSWLVFSSHLVLCVKKFKGQFSLMFVGEKSEFTEARKISGLFSDDVVLCLKKLTGQFSLVSIPLLYLFVLWGIQLSIPNPDLCFLCLKKFKGQFSLMFSLLFQATRENRRDRETG